MSASANGGRDRNSGGSTYAKLRSIHNFWWITMGAVLAVPLLAYWMDGLEWVRDHPGAFGSVAQGIATFAVSAFVAYIGWQQYFTAKSKLKLDLYDRRYKVYLG